MTCYQSAKYAVTLFVKETLTVPACFHERILTAISVVHCPLHVYAEGGGWHSQHMQILTQSTDTVSRLTL